MVNLHFLIASHQFVHRYIVLYLKVSWFNKKSDQLSHPLSSSVCRQVYISEIAGPDIRGCLSAVLKVFGHVGVLISFALGAYLDWRQLAFVVAGAPLMLLVSLHVISL